MERASFVAESSAVPVTPLTPATVKNRGLAHNADGLLPKREPLAINPQRVARVCGFKPPTEDQIVTTDTDTKPASTGDLLRQLRQRFHDDPTAREEIAREGLSLSALGYSQDVRDLAEELEAGCKDGTIANEEALDQTLHESVDGSGRVIYTHQAMQCLIHSDNGSIGPEEMGAEAFDWSDGVPWSQLAFFAFRADVQDRLPDTDELFPEEEEDESATPEHDD